MTTLVEVIGDRVRQSREKKNWRLADLAEKSQLSLQYISNIEHGRGNPTIEALGMLAFALDLTLTDLVDGL